MITLFWPENCSTPVASPGGERVSIFLHGFKLNGWGVPSKNQDHNLGRQHKDI